MSETPAGPLVRVLLRASGILVLAAGVVLFVFPGDTDRLFAWTIQPPITAAFLGAGYLAAAVLEWTSVRDGRWRHLRISFVSVLAFVGLTLAATLLHLDKFHFDSPQAVARIAAWGWTGVYVSVPLAMVLALVLQPAASDDGTPRIPMPPLGRGLLAVLGAASLVVGGLLFAAPERWASLWPWELTPLTARAVAAWLLGIGLAAVLQAGEGDLDRRPMALAFVALGALQAVALTRHAGDVRWDDPAAWAYAAAVLLVLGLGLAALVLQRARG